MQIVSSAKSPPGHPWLVPAFAISLAFHLFLLWSLPDSAQEGGPAAPIRASLRPEPPPAASQPSAAPARKAETIKTPTVVAAPPAAVAAATPSTASQPVRSGPAPAQESRSALPAASAAMPTGPIVSAEGLRQYRLALAREVGRHKHYPDRAIEAGWSGTAELRVKVTPGLGLPVAELTKSSGHAVLDDAALEMLNMAMPATPIPASLQARAFSVELPIVFELPE